MDAGGPYCCDGKPAMFLILSSSMIERLLILQSRAICELARTPNATHTMMYPLDSASRSLTAFGLNGSVLTVVVNSG